MASVVEELVVELNARTERLEQGLAKARAEIGKTVPTTTAAGAAAGNMGQRYGSAATQIASAAENMARMGKVTGEASKQILSQGAQVAFAFGPTGAIVGAVSIATLAIVELFGRTERAAAAAREELQQLGRSGSLQQAQSKALLLLHGDRFAEPEQVRENPELSGIAALKARKARADALRREGRALEAAPLTRDEEQALARLEKSYAKVLDLVKEFSKVEAERTDFSIRLANEKKKEAAGEALGTEAERVAAAASKAQIDDLTNAWEAGIAKQGAAIEARDKKVAESAKRSAEAAKFLRETLTRQTETLVDDIELSFEEPMKKAAEAGNWLLFQELVAARDAAVALRHGIEDVNEQARLLGIDFKDVANAADSVTTPVTKTTEELINQARAVQQAVDGALQLAEAFGMVDKNVASSLRAVTQIATNIPALSSAWSKRNEGGKDGGFGNVVGAALPIAGAAATIVTGFLSAAKAAREHAEALRAARAKLSESLRDRNAALGLNDTQRRFADVDTQRKGDIAAMLDLLIQQKGVSVGTRADFLAKDATGQRAVLTDALAKADHAGVREALRAAIEQFDLLAESARKAKEQLEAELVEKRRDIDQSLAERRLKLAGRTDEMDALAFARAMEKELADARAGGVYTAEQLIELQSILNDEQTKYIADQKKRLDEEAAAKARQVQVDREDLQTRINAADGESPAERARRRGIEKEREILDWMAKGADSATLALVRLAQSADDAAAAAREAMAAQREVQDLDVELLQLQGKTAEAEARAAELALQRRWDDAVAAGKDPDVLAKLAEVIAAKRAELAAKQIGGAAAAAGAAAGPSAVASAGGATSAAGTGIGTATIVQVDRMLGILGTIAAVIQQGNAERIKQTALMMRGSGWVIQPPSIPSEYRSAAGQSMAGATVIQFGGIRVNVVAPDGANPSAFGSAISRAVLDAIEVGMANNSLLSSLGRGQVGR